MIPHASRAGTRSGWEITLRGYMRRFRSVANLLCVRRKPRNGFELCFEQLKREPPTTHG